MLANKVALVTGASRGVGKGIATELGKAGATVYITALEKHKEDPFVQKNFNKLPQLSDTANEINKSGGRAIVKYCDHNNDVEVKNLFDQIAKEQNNRLDICVSNAFAAVTLMIEIKHKKFWTLPQSVYDFVNNGVGLRGHYLTCSHAAKLMVPQKSGLILATSSPGGLAYIFSVVYGMNKAAVDKMCADMAIELKSFNVACMSFWQMAVRSELLMNCGLIQDEKTREHYIKNSTSVEFPGKCVVELAKEKNIMSKTGKIVTDIELAREYNLKDTDGTQPWCPMTSKCLTAIQHVNDVRRNVLL